MVRQKKTDFRRKIKKTLCELGGARLEERSQKLSRLLNDPMQSRRHLLWGVFAPLKDEPQWHVQIEGPENFQLAFPKFEGRGKMSFRQCSRGQLLENQDFGVKILCPPDNSPRVSPQALLVPARGLTRRGERMGRGGGYYDRLLNTFQGLSIGLCFSEQLYPELSTAEHDQKVQMVVTDEEVIHCEA